MTTLLGEEESQRVARLGHRDVESIIVQADRDSHVLPRHIFGDESEGLGIGLVPPEVRDRHPEELRQRANEIALFENAHLNEEFAEAATGLRLELQRFLDLIVRNKTPQDKDVTELLSRVAGSPIRRGNPFSRWGRMRLLRQREPLRTSEQQWKRRESHHHA